MNRALSSQLEALFERVRAGIQLGLGPTQHVLQTLGNPEAGRHFIVVAGTNGKGSTAACLAAILTAAGYKTGLFTSPHLVHFGERIRIDGARVQDEDIGRWLADIHAAERRAGKSLTFFEVSTVMALLAFREAATDIDVLEVGMGGRLDATNVVPKTLSVITAVGFDHQEYLGHTLSAIAGEKAGILQKETPAVVARQQPEAWQTIAQRGEALGCRIVRPARVTKAVPTHHGQWQLDLAEGTPQTFTTAMGAPFLHTSIATAVAASHQLRALGFPISGAALQRGVAGFRWPGRYQWLRPWGLETNAGASQPLRASEAGSAGPQVDVLLDAAHNPEAISALQQALAQDPRAARPYHLVTTVLEDRTDHLVAPLAQAAARVYWTPVANSRSRSVAGLEHLCAAFGGAVYANVRAALSAAQSAAAADGGFVMVTGSLYLVGACLEALGVEP